MCGPLATESGTIEVFSVTHRNIWHFDIVASQTSARRNAWLMAKSRSWREQFECTFDHSTHKCRELCTSSDSTGALLRLGMRRQYIEQ